ncbi:uncharacterized protein EV420DRAFT_457077 [Desarmillaria tabescens]|uniref:Uncharacterized protein n=1 Tax=Armillaria tabescens TaxID=1929756 RepID=A0AA39NMN1_ARMTA|nr:uncharacterized protein EV420DRAFT_457077 [Desarmillaria tabescens]KAK0468304.1 hypothetical protein EV420DRAFT_457077 [Desarmillaria tabescens]
MRFDIFKRLGPRNSPPGSPMMEDPAMDTWHGYSQTHEGSRGSGSDHSPTQASGGSTRRRRLQKRASGSQPQYRRASRDTGYATTTTDSMESFEILPNPESEVGVYHRNPDPLSPTSGPGRFYYKDFSAEDLTEDSHGLTRSHPKPINKLPPPMESTRQGVEHQPTQIPVYEEGYSLRPSSLGYSRVESPVLPSLFDGNPSQLPTSDSSSFKYDHSDPMLQDVPRSTPTYHDPEMGVSPSVPVHHSHTEETPPRRHSHHSRSHHHKRSRHRSSHDQERKKPSTYYIVPGGMRVIFRDREGNEITRVGNWSETRQKHISPIIVQDENGKVLYRSDSDSQSSSSPSPPRIPRTPSGAEWQGSACPNCTRQRSSTSSWQSTPRSYISYPRDERPNIVLIDGEGRQIPL